MALLSVKNRKLRRLVVGAWNHGSMLSAMNGRGGSNFVGEIII